MKRVLFFILIASSFLVKAETCALAAASVQRGVSSTDGENSKYITYDKHIDGDYNNSKTVFLNSVVPVEKEYRKTIFPLRLNYFRATLTSNFVNLDWATSKHENFNQFIIERSSGGSVFEPIGEVDGHGQDQQGATTVYSFQDKNPQKGANYYRLKALNPDRTFEYFNIVYVSFDRD